MATKYPPQPDMDTEDLKKWVDRLNKIRNAFKYLY